MPIADAGTAANPETDSAPYAVDLEQGPVADGEDWHFGPLTFFRRKSPDGLLPTIIDPGDGLGKAVRLAVKTGAYVGPLADDADRSNDRCELRGPKQRLGTDVWHGFAIRVPPGFPVRPLRCVVAQMKMPYDASGDGSPAFALRVDNGHWLATVEHLYEPDDKKAGRYLSDPVGGVCCAEAGVPAFDHSNFNKYVAPTDFQVRALIASDGVAAPSDVAEHEFARCTTGVGLVPGADLPVLRIGGGWTDFVVRIRSSGVKNQDGIIELYADGALVAEARGEFGYPSTDGEPVQYFKIGLYRNNDLAWGTEVAALDYRNIRRGRSAAEVGLGLVA